MCQIQKAPLAVTVFNNQFMQDVAALDIQEIARYTAGATATVQLGSGQVSLRGISVTSGFLRDGMQQFVTTDTANNQSLALIERVEIIKGPAGTLFGMHSPGGVVNYVSKAPKYTQQTTLSFMAVPQNDLYVAEADHTAPLGNGWAYRTVVSAKSGKYFVGTRDDARAAAVSLSKKFGRDDRGMFLARVTGESARYGAPSPWIADAAGQISTFLARDKPVSERDTARDKEALYVDLEANYRYAIGNAPTESRLSFRYSEAEQDLIFYSTGTSNYRFYGTNGALLGNMTNSTFADPRFSYVEVTRAVLHEERELDTWVLNFDTVSSFSTGPVSHKLLAYATANPIDSTQFNESASYARQNMANITYLKNPDDGRTGPWVLTTKARTETFEYAFAAQDNLSILDERVILVAGVRYNNRILDRWNFHNNTRVSNDERDGLTQKWAVVVTPIESLSLYYSYAETFNPSGFDSISGNPLPNLETSNNEFGLKVRLPDGRFAMTAAYFDIETTNVLVQGPAQTNPITGAVFFSTIPAGSQTVSGWEVDFTANLSKDLSLLGGIGKLSTKTQVGLIPRGVSEELGWSLFTRYDLPMEVLTGKLWTAVGWERSGKRPGDNGNVFFLPAFDLVDFIVGWQGRKLALQLNITNAFDTLKAKVSTSDRDVMPTEPTTARLSVKWRF